MLLLFYIKIIFIKVSAFWYLYFDEIWYVNYERNKEVETNFLLLNPEYPSFIGYHFLNQDDLEALLEKTGLNKIILEKHIKSLYEKIQQIMDNQACFNFVSVYKI